MYDNLPPEIGAPLALIAWAAAIYAARHWLAAWLGFKEDNE